MPPTPGSRPVLPLVQGLFGRGLSVCISVFHSVVREQSRTSRRGSTSRFATDSGRLRFRFEEHRVRPDTPTLRYEERPTQCVLLAKPHGDSIRLFDSPAQTFGQYLIFRRHDGDPREAVAGVPRSRGCIRARSTTSDFFICVVVAEAILLGGQLAACSSTAPGADLKPT